MYLINEVSRQVELSQKRIREYEKEGFIKPVREKRTNNRLYSDFDIRQIKRINYLIHERGFTVSCLRNLLVLAPCWNVFGCHGREQCAAFQNPHRRCWDLRRGQDRLPADYCEFCAIYLNRESGKERLLEPSGAGAMEIATSD